MFADQFRSALAILIFLWTKILFSCACVYKHFPFPEGPDFAFALDLIFAFILMSVGSSLEKTSQGEELLPATNFYRLQEGRNSNNIFLFNF